MIDEILMANSVPKYFSGENLIGRKFGNNNIVLAYKGIDNNRSSLWLVRCECGREDIVRRTNIVGKNIRKSCIECGYKNMGEGNRKDIAGVIFGNNCRVISFSYSCGSDRFWLCRCGCCNEDFFAEQRRINTGKFPIYACKKCSKNIGIKKRVEIRKKKIDNITSPGGLYIKNREQDNNSKLVVVCPYCNKDFICSYVAVFNKKRPQQMCFECSYREKRCKEKHHNWNEKLTDEERKISKTRYSLKEYQELLRSVFKRDNYKSVISNKNTKDLRIHHLDSWGWAVEKRYNLDNCKTLTEKEHKDFHKQYGYGDNWKNQFNDYIQSLKVEYII